MAKITIKAAYKADGSIRTTEIKVNTVNTPGISGSFLPAGTSEAIRNGLLRGGIIGKEDGFALTVNPALPKDANPAPLALAAAIAVTVAVLTEKDATLNDEELCIAAVGYIDLDGNAVPADIDIEETCIGMGADILYVAEGHKGYSEEGDGKCHGTLVTCLKDLTQMPDVELNIRETALEKTAEARRPSPTSVKG